MREEYQSNPIIRTRYGARLFVQRFNIAESANELHPCYQGHQRCSPDLHGPCYDETMTNFPDE
jgi:hypothetical protein